MRRRRGRLLFAAGFLAPAAILYAVFVLIPLFQTVQFSFYSLRGVSDAKRWVGLHNYERLAADGTFWQVLGNVGKFALIGGLAVFILGMALAHAIQGASWWSRGLRAIYLLPHVLSVVAVAIVWRFLYLPGNGLLSGVGVTGPSDGFLGSSATALPSVVVAWIWFALGFYTMLFAAGLQSIDAEVTEAALLDGATGWRRFQRITFPLLFTVRRMATIYVVVHVANVFALVNVMTDGGPARSTETLLTFLYELAFKHTKMGYGSALATVNILLIVVATAALTFAYRRNPTEGRR